MIWKIKLKSLITYLIYTAALLTAAYFLNRFFQMLMFILFFSFIQNCFYYRFHADTIVKDHIKALKYCKIITICVELIYLILCKDLNISVYSNLFLIFAIAFTNSVLEFSLEMFVIKQNCFKDKETLLALYLKANLTENASKRMLLKYIDNKTYKEIAEIECVDIETIKKSINRSRKKIFENREN